MELTGLLWSAPSPTFIAHFEFLNWATLFSLAGLIFYLMLEFKVAFIMFFVSTAMLASVYLLSATPYLLPISGAVFFLAWVAQLIGHKIEGQKPSFLEDLSFLLIGPLWTLKKLKLL